MESFIGVVQGDEEMSARFLDMEDGVLIAEKR